MATCEHSDNAGHSEITIIANSIKQESRGDNLEIASELIHLVNDSVKVVAAKRLKSRIVEKQGLVKIRLSNLKEKIVVSRWKCTTFLIAMSLL